MSVIFLGIIELTVILLDADVQMPQIPGHQLQQGWPNGACWLVATAEATILVPYHIVKYLADLKIWHL